MSRPTTVALVGWLVLLAAAHEPAFACQDLDGDGFYHEAGCGTPRDCNDTASAIRPGAVEACDGYDDDCNGAVDDDPSCDTSCDLAEAWWRAALLANFGVAADLVWTGSGYGAVWQGYSWGTEFGNLEIYFARIDPSGRMTGPVTRVTSSEGASTDPSLVWTGQEYGVVWHDDRDADSEIYFARLDAAGTKIGTDVRVTNEWLRTFQPSLVWTGREYGIAWANEWWDGGWSGVDIRFVRLDASGNQVGGETWVSRVPALSWWPSLVWTGSGFGVSWYGWMATEPLGNWEIFFARLDETGLKLDDDVRVTNAAGGSAWPSLVWTGSEYGVAWDDGRDDSREIYFARIDASGTKLASDVRITDAAGSSHNASLVWTGSEYGLTWDDDREGGQAIYFARIDAAGNRTGPDLRVTGQAAVSAQPSLVWTGSDYRATWSGDGVWFGGIGCNCGDSDLDGFSRCNDCDDGDSGVFPGAPEVCNGRIDDCRHADWPGPDDVDSDSDGFTVCDGDCEDSRSADFPGAPQICDGRDNDCSAPGWPQVPANEIDHDNDWFSACQGDCDDQQAAVSPAALESCNQVDDDCNGLVDEDPLGEDTDRDRLHNLCDNCPQAPNAAQSDLDADGEGDSCDLDDGMIYIAFSRPDRVEWQPEAGFESWNSYRGDLALLRLDPPLAYTQDPMRVPLAGHSCDLPTTWAVDPDPPPAGMAVFFLTTGNEVDTGIESSLGVDSDGVERWNRFPCP